MIRSMFLGRFRITKIFNLVFYYNLGWLACFYPQLWLNFKRKSCIGLNIDYCVLNFIGFL